MLRDQFKKSKRSNDNQIWRDPSTHYLNALNDTWYRSLFKLKADIASYTHLFFNNRRFASSLFPMTTGSISSPMGLGSDSKPVMVTIANVETYLADSMQFMLEYALRFHEEGVYYIMPSFRGEEADKRHLCQFYHIEAEISGGLNDVIQLVNDYLHYLVTQLLNYSCSLLKDMTDDFKHIEKFLALNGDVPQVRFNDAVDLLKDKPDCFEEHEAGFLKITDHGEQQLIELFHGPVWLTHFPKLSVPFYQADEVDSSYSMSADLLMGIGETVGLGQRHETDKEAIKALAERGVNSAPYNWYLKMREASPMQTSGFGMGLERFILWLTQHDDIRDCQIIPRFNGIDIIP